MQKQNLLIIKSLLELYQEMGIKQIPHFIPKDALVTSPSITKNNLNTQNITHPKYSDANTNNSPPQNTKQLIHETVNSRANSLSQQFKININKYQFLNDIYTLEALKVSVNNFEGCDLKKTAMNTVFGVGNPDANIMLIGEAPGADEDIQGEPFVGRSGKLLMKALNSINLDRENLFITNTVFWRPPANRNPTIEEMIICYPFLTKMINIIKPKIIILVGKVATNNILKLDTPISKIRGMWYNVSFSMLQEGTDIETIVVFHPAYLLRNPSKKQILWQDLITIMNKINELKL